MRGVARNPRLQNKRDENRLLCFKFAEIVCREGGQLWNKCLIRKNPFADKFLLEGTSIFIMPHKMSPMFFLVFSAAARGRGDHFRGRGGRGGHRGGGRGGFQHRR